MNVEGASGDHKNLEDYLTRDMDIEGTLDDITEKEENSIRDSIQVTTEYCPDRVDALRYHVSIKGKDIGYFSADNLEIMINVEFDENGGFRVE